jgi:hypothetical protein
LTSFFPSFLWRSSNLNFYPTNHLRHANQVKKTASEKLTLVWRKAEISVSVGMCLRYADADVSLMPQATLNLHECQ